MATRHHWRKYDIGSISKQHQHGIIMSAWRNGKWLKYNEIAAAKCGGDSGIKKRRGKAGGILIGAKSRAAA